MVYALVVIVLALIVGGVGNSSHNSLISELATVVLLAGLIMLGRAAWQRRHKPERDSR